MGSVATTVIVEGQPLDPTVPDANWAAILAELNGNLQALVNVKVASASSITGKANTAGSSDALAAADHSHIVQGVENLASDPASGNFNGRVWWDTTSSQWKGITDLSGPTIKVIGNLAASDLVLHASQHVDGAADQLADTSIAERSMKSRTIYSATQASDVGPMTTATWTTIVDLTGVTTTGVQTLDVNVNLFVVNGAGAARRVYFRIVDVTNSNTTIYRSEAYSYVSSGAGGDRGEISVTFPYTVPATGARTLRLQADANGDQVTITKPTTVTGDTFIRPNLTAVIK